MKNTLADSELRYRRLFEATQDGILILDAKTGLIADVNPFLIKMLGYSREELVEKKLWEVGAFKDIEASKIAFGALQETEYIRYEDLPLKAKDGHLIQVEFVSSVYLVGEEKVIQCNIRDITDRKKAQDALIKSEALLWELSTRDSLTGLFNRRYLEETLDRELHHAGRKNLPLGVIMLDVDNLKQFNDTSGHAAGDVVLRELGKMLIECVRKEDIPSRYGGDEFIIILPDASLEVTLKRAELISERVKQYIHQFENKALNTISLSSGVAIFPDHGLTSLALLKSADDALYQAKAEGRDRIIVAK
jgi:diguanylate cyclase (GGDEF)-like protein/PAS domain S-box-containing protein